MESIACNPNYKITKDGRLFSSKRNKWLMPNLSIHGYYKYCFRIDNKQKLVSAHRLVAQTYIDNPLNKPYVNHLNGIKTDNRVENLEWCTALENQLHALNVLNKRVHWQRGVAHHNAKLNPEKVDEIRKRYKLGGCTHRSLARDFGVSCLAINHVINFRTWKEPCTTTN